MSTDSNPSTLTGNAARRWLGGPRLGRYLGPSSGDLTRAVNLYRWNSATAAAAAIDLGHLEVAIRNAYDRQLWGRFPDWLNSSSALWQVQAGDEARRSRQRQENDRTLDALDEARRGLRHLTSGHVIANTSFGLWCSMTDPHREPTLWTPMLRHAYPGGTTRGVAHELTAKCNGFRNRVAHNEPVFTRSTALAQRVREMRLLHALIDPESANWAFTYSQVVKMMDRCPCARARPSPARPSETPHRTAPLTTTGSAGRRPPVEGEQPRSRRCSGGGVGR